MNIAVHITYFQYNDKKREKFLKKIVLNYLKFKCADIFIHSNKNFILKKRNNKIKTIVYKLNNEHPFYLSWKYRKLMEKQKKLYDYFIYSEDDILFTYENFLFWKKNYMICEKNNYNLGFVRVENNGSKGFYCVDIFKKLDTFINLDKKKFILNTANPYCAFWIMDRNQFSNFIKTNVWKFKWKKNYQSYGDIRAMSAMGLHGLNVGYYKSTLIPLYNNKISKKSLVIHLDNKYSITKHGLGSLKFANLLGSNLIKFTPYIKYKNIIKRIINKII